MRHAAAASLALMSIALAGCGGGATLMSEEPAEKPATVTPVSADAGKDVGMEGRWILAAPRAPSCGLMLSGGPAAAEGRIAPEGGCPERFFLARRWRLADGMLTIVDDDGAALASFRNAGDRFEGKSAAETQLTLSR